MNPRDFIPRKTVKKQLLKRKGSICSKEHGHGCGQSFKPHELTIDHIIPIALGGNLADPSNLQLLCQDCHRKKTFGKEQLLTNELYGLSQASKRKIFKLEKRLEFVHRNVKP